VSAQPRTEAIPSSPRLAQAFTEHLSFVRERLRGLGVMPADLDDATQDVFLVLVRRIADYDPRWPIRHWLAGMARRVARRYRDQGRRTLLHLDESRARDDGGTDRQLAHAEAHDVLDQVLASLNADQWAVFVLGEIEGLRGTEIAAELGLNLNTVYARLRSAKTVFDRVLRRHRARERRGLAAWLLGLAPGRSLRLAGAAVVLAVAIVGSIAVLRMGCAHEERTGTATRSRPTPPVAGSPSGGAGGPPARATDPPTAPPATLAVAPSRAREPESWREGPALLTQAPAGSLSSETRYRMHRDRLVHEITHIGDDDVEMEIRGVYVTDGLDLIDGSLEHTSRVGAGATEVTTQEFVATREGCVSLRLDASLPGGTTVGSTTLHLFRERGSLREPELGECPPPPAASSGSPIEIDVVNDCDRPVEFTVFAGSPVPDGHPRERLDAGEHRTMRIDAGQWIRRDGGGVHVDEPAEVHFFGEQCDGLRTATRPRP
jgi:RNA polymerase sigma-70 factor, ECF subfamily